MATNYKVLGQVAPAATTLTTLYTSPASTQTVISTVSVCNRSNSVDTYRIAVQPAGAAISNQHYVAYGATVAANDTVNVTIGMTLAATDVISVYAGTTNLSFNAFGSQIS